MTSSLKFGTSGLRGLATDLVGEEARRYAAAFCRYARSSGSPTILIGRDLRTSSPEIAASVISAVTALGLQPVDCGPLPTPALALESASQEAPAIMVTGSHIPADRNGLKFYLAKGEIDKTDESGIVALLADAPIGPPGARSSNDALRRYRERAAHILAPKALAGWRIGVWQHSSVMRDLLVEVLGAYGAQVVPLGRSDAFVAVDTEAVSEEVAAQLSGWVRAHNLNAVVSTDGDADRPLMVDENGALIRGDVIGILTARFLGADIVVTPVTSNSSIEGTSAFRRVVRTKVGSPYVIAAMADALQADAGRTIVGFEANGGVLLGTDARVNGISLKALPTRDAMLPILSLLGAAGASARSLSELVATLPRRFSRSDRLEHVAVERSARLLEALNTEPGHFFAAQGAISDISRIDGLRFTFASGEVIHYRPSGNAPELRCYTEAGSEQRAAELLAWGLEAAAKFVR